MIINLTGKPVRVYGPDAPDVIADDQLDGCTVFPAEVPPARMAIEVLDAGQEALHGIRTVPLYLVRHNVAGLPPRRPNTHLIVEPIVGVVSHGRADLLIPLDEVHDATGAAVGHRFLGSPC
ncbi:hypothetical protein [Streptomyces erythrochromogenes]|uniref:hypothetical protein n=1 Tax=Streptomyces erythrochromogenes TaxID=285574 RepID=UPI00342F2F58